MPVLSGDRQGKKGEEAVDRLNHLVSTGHWERSAREKIVLDIDHNQRLHAYP
jgi:hypothetical protein